MGIQASLVIAAGQASAAGQVILVSLVLAVTLDSLGSVVTLV